jgi:aminopeptidase N
MTHQRSVLSRYRNVCRVCEEFGAKAGSRRSFVMAASKPHYAPDRPFRIEHILLEVEVDPVGKTLRGKAKQKLRSVVAGQTEIALDQIGLQIEEVMLNGQKTSFSAESGRLKIRLEKPSEAGEEIEVEALYSVHNPRRGIYFTGPDEQHPSKRKQVWTQGQDEDVRYWFPTLDYPNQKAASEVLVTVPKGYTAISNGALLGKKDLGEKTQFHYKIAIPHVTYLITLVVGEFTQWEDNGPRGLPVQYFVEPGREADGRRAFGNTPKMIEAYEKKIGVAYPYEKYSQVAVQDFIFGGMENTSATTQTDLTLHDERAHLDFSSDHLVAHELAHQWFGDLLTCRDWSNGWLNEGFATFMERVWVENDHGPHGGFEEAKYYSYNDLRDHIEEDTRRYRRPIVCNNYIEPMDLFDTHLYQKGGLVVGLIRTLLGEDLFWKSIQHYVTKHQKQNVETLDLIRAIEETTGRNLRQVFDEWVFGAGYPEFEVSYNWHDEKKLAELVIEQKQTGGLPSVTSDGATTHLFHLPVVIEFTLEDGKKQTHRLDLFEARERIFLAVSGKPLMVRFDPNFTIPKTLKFPRPKELLLYQLKNDQDCMGRIEAAQELVKLADPEIVSALGDVAAKDSFWGVQAEVADALSQIRTDQARDGLIAALSSALPKGRREIVRALGTFRDDKSAAALKKLAEKDPSYFVEAQATLAWSQAHVGVYNLAKEPKAEEIEKFLLKQLEKSSYREVIRAAALQALGALPGVGTGERPKALEVLMSWSRREKPSDARVASISALGKLARAANAPEQKTIFSLLDTLADEDSFRMRMALIVALSATESSHAIGILEKIHTLDVDPRVRRNALAAIDALQTAGNTPESVSRLKSAIEKLEEEQRKMRSLFEENRKPS